MTPEFGQENEAKERYPYFGLIGPVGVGKTSWGEEFARSFGIARIEENFSENPYLNGFYTKNPADFSFDVQVFFLLDKCRQMRFLQGKLTGSSVLHDPELAQDLLIAKAQHQIGWMSKEQYATYCRVAENIYAGGYLPQPDVTIALLAKYEIIERRIVKRGREDELAMLKRYPDYFRMIAEAVEAWVEEKGGNKSVIAIRVDEYELFDEKQKDYVIKELKNWARYHLTSAHKLNGRGKDGAELIIPDFLRPDNRIHDTFPGANPESKRFFHDPY